MRIRPAVIADAAAIGRLVTELGYPTAAAAMQHYYERDGPHCRLLALVVAADARGRGIGGQLVQAVETWARGRGARTILVTSALHRVEAHRFYEDRGYARTGYRFVKPLEP